MTQELRSEQRNPFTKFLRPEIKKIAVAAKRRSLVSRIAAKRGGRRRRSKSRSTGFVQAAPQQSTIGQIISGLKTVALGKSTVPLPGVGMLGAGRGMQLQAIGRQQLARVPLAAKLVGGAVGVTAATEAITGQSPIPLARQLLLQGGGKVLGSPNGRVTEPFKPSHRVVRRPMPSRNGLAVGQELPPSHIVVRTWQTFPGGPIFARLADGHIAVQKKDGTIKHFRPYRPVVIPRKWNARSMSRVATALKRQRKTATKIMQITGGMPKGRK